MVVLGQEWLYLGGLVGFRQKWFCLGRMVVSGQKGLYLGTMVVFWQEWLYLGRMVVFVGQQSHITWRIMVSHLGLSFIVCSVLIIILAARLIYMQTKVVVHVFRQKCLGNSGCFHENGSTCIWAEWLY